MHPKEGSRSLSDLDGQKWKLLSDVFDGTLVFQRKEASRLYRRADDAFARP